VAKPVALISGGARGIGFATARRLAVDHRIALLDLDPAALEQAAARCGPDAITAVCDITDQAQVDAAIAHVVAEAGGIDVVFSNAGIGGGGSLRLLDPDVLAAIVNVNLIGNWRLIHAALPYVIERRGYIIANASASALMPAIGFGAYASSKAALEHLMNVLRGEVAHLGVDVGVSYFWFVGTDMVEGAEREMGRIGELRSEMPGPLKGIVSVETVGERLAEGIRSRARRVVAPRWVTPIFFLRGVIGSLVDRGTAGIAAELDDATAERIAEQGSFAAAFRSTQAGHRSAAGSVGQPLGD
jgi:NAD(P)-dependent dehydrogenase (short-subunit alcohol dehydrogenase family)